MCGLLLNGYLPPRYYQFSATPFNCTYNHVFIYSEMILRRLDPCCQHGFSLLITKGNDLLYLVNETLTGHRNFYGMAHYSGCT